VRRGLPALALGLALGLGAAAVPGAPTLAVDGPAWVLAGRGVELTVRQGGALAGQRLRLLLFVDGDLVERASTGGDVSRVRLSPPALAAGRHVLLVKSGSESATLEVRAVSAGRAAALALTMLLLAGAAAAIRLARRRRRPPAG
jgi:hypothetical protein